MGSTGSSETVARLYRRLLDRVDEIEVEALLEEALALLADTTGAAMVYLELQGPGQVLLTKGLRTGQTASEAIRASISRGIIRHVLGLGETVETSSAIADARFHELGSVKQHEIQAVLAAPIGRSAPIGVIYLQGASGSPGTCRPRAFASEARTHIEVFANEIEAIAGRLLGDPASATTLEQATARFQRRYLEDTLDRHRWNVSETARVLDVSRSSLYELMKALGIRRRD